MAGNDAYVNNGPVFLGKVRRLAHGTAQVHDTGELTEVMVLDVEQPDGLTARIMMPIGDVDALANLLAQLQVHLAEPGQAC